MNVLLVEHDRRLGSQLRRGLKAEGYVVDLAPNNEAGLNALAAVDYDVAVLDPGAEGSDAVGICRQIRSRGYEVAILLLMPGDAVFDRVRGLDAGADDCLTKPFAFVELLARVKAVVRRRERQVVNDVLEAGDLSLDLLTRQAWQGEQLIDLTAREFTLLEAFLRRPNEVMTRPQLLAQVWGLDYLGASNVVDVYVRYLRTKLKAAGGAVGLETVRGAGYRLRAPREPGPRRVPRPRSADAANRYRSSRREASSAS